MWGTASFEQWPRRTIQRAPVFFDVSPPFKKLLEPTPYNKRSSSSRTTLIPLSLFLDFRYPSPLLEWLNRARRVQNSSRVSDRESVEPRRFFGEIHADRKSTTMVSFHFQNVVRERKKLVGHRFSLFLSLSRWHDEGISRAGGRRN